jgi:fructuronate reductase
VRLSGATLNDLPCDVTRPAYNQSTFGIGVVHLGIGAFHRAHQAVYFDDLLARRAGDWRILGVSLRSPAVRDQLAPQDGLFTLAERDNEGTRLRVIGSVAGVLVAPEEPQKVIEALAAPSTRMVTLTITEKGYCHDPATGRLNGANPDIVHDLARPEQPVSALGFLAEGLNRRRLSGAAPLTLISCDNLPHNGAVLRDVLVSFADALDPELGAWIEANVAFPSTMVDRIVPATTEADRAGLLETQRYQDQGLVKAEPFSQWVIEDRFASERPPFESVGVQMVADVRPFELAKLRMLNGAHSALAYLGLQAGHAYVHDAMADTRIAASVDRLLTEAASTLPQVPGLEVVTYAEALKERFANRALEHRLAQIAMDGSQKLPQRLLGTIADVHAAGGTAWAAARGVAAWVLHLGGPHLNDPLADELRGLAGRPIGEVLAFAPVFGALGRESWFAKLITGAMAEIVPERV